MSFGVSLLLLGFWVFVDCYNIDFAFLGCLGLMCGLVALVDLDLWLWCCGFGFRFLVLVLGLEV